MLAADIYFIFYRSKRTSPIFRSDPSYNNNTTTRHG